MKYITILDFNWGRVWKFTYPQEVIDAIINKDNSLDESEAFEQWIVELGFSLNDIHYMFHSDGFLYTEEDL
jgi:hypothetical protein